MVVENIEKLTTFNDIPYRQAIVPTSLSGTFVIDDSLDHDFKVDARGKGRFSVVVDIDDSDQTITVQVYGSPDIDADVGDAGVIQIGADFTVTDAEDIDYETVADPFPFYIIRITPAASATGTPACILYVHFSAF